MERVLCHCGRATIFAFAHLPHADDQHQIVTKGKFCSVSSHQPPSVRAGMRTTSQIQSRILASDSRMKVQCLNLLWPGKCARQTCSSTKLLAEINSNLILVIQGDVLGTSPNTHQVLFVTFLQAQRQVP